jgi:hypothetical protein
MDIFPRITLNIEHWSREVRRAVFAVFIAPLVVRENSFRVGLLFVCVNQYLEIV